jgi:3-deoxy-D-manno-octulosonate 8-phosphate phosphatase (KDO 8-P phosphatase)
MSEDSARQRAARLRVMGFDVDGVLTDGRLYFGAHGEAMKAFDTMDGYGVKLLAATGVVPAIITGRRSEIVAARAAELGIVHVYQGVRDKAAAFAELLAATGASAGEAGFMGDDWPDLPALTRAGFAAAPAGAHPDVLARVHWVATAAGGRGALRQVAEFILRAQGRYEAMLAAACGDLAQ